MITKIALCFFISGDHVLKKEHIWREWIKHSKDLFHIYFHYTDKSKIVSQWILDHLLPEKYIVPTAYFYMIPAYMSMMQYAFYHDKNTEWFFFLTESCVPIVSPERFVSLFHKYRQYTLMKWGPPWWNIHLHKRANLRYIPKEYQLGHDPWFVMTRKHITSCFHIVLKEKRMYQVVCDGGLANESIIAIMIKWYGSTQWIKKESSTAADWTRMTSATSPHVFLQGNSKDVEFINNVLRNQPCTMFLRKIHTDFPDDLLNDFIYHYHDYPQIIHYVDYFFACLLVSLCICSVLTILFYSK